MKSVPVRGPRSGFSLLELLIVTAIFGVLLGSIGLIGTSGHGAFEAGSSRSELEVRVRRAVDRVAAELLVTSSASLALFADEPFWDDELVFERIVDVSELDGSIVTEPTRFAFEYAPGEVDDGIDNNGNGVADEGLLVMDRAWGLAGQKRVVLCRWVREYAEGETGNGDDDDGNGLADDRGLRFSRVGDVLSISLTLERPDSDSRPLVRTVTTSIWMRN